MRSCASTSASFGYDCDRARVHGDALWEIGTAGSSARPVPVGCGRIHRVRLLDVHVRAALAQRTSQMRDHEGDDLQGCSSRPCYERGAPRRATSDALVEEAGF